MKPNSFLKKLGFSDNDRAVIVYTDDIGVGHALVQALEDLWVFGLITSGAKDGAVFVVPGSGTDVQRVS